MSELPPKAPPRLADGGHPLSRLLAPARDGSADERPGARARIWKRLLTAKEPLRWKVPALAAAVVAAVLGAVLVARPAAPAPAFAQLTLAAGEVQSAVAAAPFVTARVGELLPEGARLRVAPEGRAFARFESAGALFTGPSRAHLSRSPRGPVLHLEEGTAAAFVERGGLRVEADVYGLDVEGGVFQVKAGAERAVELFVQEGAVTVRGPATEVTVRAGERWASRPGEAAAAMAPEEAASVRALAARAASEAVLEVAGPPGALVQMDGAAVGRAPVRLLASLGAHQVVASIGGAQVVASAVLEGRGASLTLLPPRAGEERAPAALPAGTVLDSAPQPLSGARAPASRPPPEGAVLDSAPQPLSGARAPASQPLPEGAVLDSAPQPLRGVRAPASQPLPEGAVLDSAPQPPSALRAPASRPLPGGAVLDSAPQPHSGVRAPASQPPARAVLGSAPQSPSALRAPAPPPLPALGPAAEEPVAPKPADVKAALRLERKLAGAPTGEERDTAAYGLARLLSRRGRHAEAVSLYAGLAERSGPWAEPSLYEVGRLKLQHLADPAGAAEAFAAYQRRYPKGALAHEVALSAIEAQLAQGGTPRALEALDHFVTDFPDSERLDDVRFIRATVRRDLGDCGGAQRDYAALREHPRHGDDASYFLAYCAQQRGEPAEARAQLAAYLRQFPRGLHVAEAEAALAR